MQNLAHKLLCLLSSLIYTTIRQIGGPKHAEKKKTL
jgi:hypothetical protein